MPGQMKLRWLVAICIAFFVGGSASAQFKDREGRSVFFMPFSLIDEVQKEHVLKELGIAPGIVVGRLQKEGLLHWNQGHGLKRTFRLVEEDA